MSKFNNPSRALAPSQAQPVPARPPVREPLRPPAPPPPASAVPANLFDLAPLNESPFVAFGFLTFCLMLLSGLVNDWAFLMFGGKGYIAAAMMVITPAVWLASGNALNGFRDKMGMFWFGLLIFMAAGLPFSVWRSNSLELLVTYVARSGCFFFYAASFATTLKRCRTLVLMNILNAVMILISCVKFGHADMSMDGRFQIPGSLFSGNSNDLGLQLTLGMTAFMFLFYVEGTWKSVLGLAGMMTCLTYMLKTGSRGCLISVALLYVFAFVVSTHKLKMILISIPILATGLLTIPAASLQRLSLIFQPPPAVELTGADISALASQAQRGELLKKSVELTFQHPVFGVGMGQFPVAVMGEAAKKGEWTAFLGTHNSYTQVSAECGIPALICYVAVIVLCFSRSYRIYRLAAGKPRFREVEGMAFCFVTGTLVYAVATFFFHIAYSGLLPLLSGQIMTLNLLAGPLLAPANESARTPLFNLRRPVPA